MRMSETSSEGLCYPEDVDLLRDSENQGGFGISNTNNSSSAMALLGCESRKCFEVWVLLQMLWTFISLLASTHERCPPPLEPKVIEIRTVSK